MEDGDKLLESTSTYTLKGDISENLRDYIVAIGETGTTDRVCSFDSWYECRSSRTKGSLQVCSHIRLSDGEDPVSYQ